MLLTFAHAFLVLLLVASLAIATFVATRHVLRTESSPPLAVAVAAFCVVVPALALGQDMTPIVDGVVQAFPNVAPYLAAIPIVQVLARAAEQLTRRSHSTWLNTAFRWLAAFPMSPSSLPPPSTK